MAFYADKDYTQDQAVLETFQAVMAGKLGLDWCDARTEKIRARPHEPDRGFTYKDIDLGSYGYSALPEDVRGSQSMAARGSEKVGKLPDLGYIVNRKSLVWSDNVPELYEEAKTRRWAPATDVLWTELDAHPLPEPVENACAQLYTFLQECELVNLDFVSRWVPLVNQEFLEQKSFMCAQMVDASRLLEVFRKRALYGGAGLKRASVSAEQGLKEWLWADTYPQGSVSINLSLGGLLLALFRHVAAFAPSNVDRVIMGYAMQDAARQAAYGAGCLRYHLQSRAARKTAMHEYLDESEHVMLAILGSPEVVEPLIIVSGGGLDSEEVKAGGKAVLQFIRLAVREYFERLEYAGLEERAPRSRIPRVIGQMRGPV